MTIRTLFAAVLLLPHVAGAEEPVTPAAEAAQVEPAPVTTVPEPAPAVAPVQTPSVEGEMSQVQLREFRERYASRKWRIGSLGGFAGSFGVHRRFGARSGLGLMFYGAGLRAFDDVDDSGYDSGGLAIAWWRERANRLFPAVVGWSLAAGPMVSIYTVMHRNEPFPVASANGFAGSGSIYAILPVFNMLFDARPRGWIPHLTIEITAYHGQVGPYSNDGNTDVDGDGVTDYRDGEEFSDPGGGTRRKISGLGGSGGLIWIF